MVDGADDTEPSSRKRAGLIKRLGRLLTGAQSGHAEAVKRRCALAKIAAAAKWEARKRI